MKKATTNRPPPVVDRVDDEILFIQHCGSVMFLNYEEAAEVADRLSALLAEADAPDGAEEPTGTC